MIKIIPFSLAKVSINTVEKMNESYESMTVTPEGSNLKDSDEEELHLIMVDNHIPAGAKLY